jgi:hypothetical protein
VRPVIEVTFLRGRGEDEDDPVRLVYAYFDPDTGEQLATLDPFADLVAKGTIR